MERAAGLRESMVAHLERSGALRAPRVAAAMRAVPRHRFVPAVPLDEAYADRAIAIKMLGSEIVSSISQPGMIVAMLELLAPEPGDRVLEIGTGSAYNAALLAEMVGSAGSVTTVELDLELAGRARATLADLGYGNVRVIAGDGTLAGAADAPFDRLVVTARSDDVATAWWDSVRPGARLVVPLRLDNAGEYAIGFVLRGERLVSIGAYPCAFIAMRTSAGAPAGDVFYRDPSVRRASYASGRVSEVVAVRRENATSALLEEADFVIARSASVFGVRLTS